MKVIFESYQPSFSFVGRGGQVKSLRKTWSYQEKHRTNSRVKQGTKEEKEKNKGGGEREEGGGGKREEGGEAREDRREREGGERRRCEEDTEQVSEQFPLRGKAFPFPRCKLARYSPHTTPLQK